MDLSAEYFTSYTSLSSYVTEKTSRCKNTKSALMFGVKTAFLAMTSHNFFCKIVFVTEFVIILCCAAFDEQPGHGRPWEFVCFITGCVYMHGVAFIIGIRTPDNIKMNISML